MKKIRVNIEKWVHGGYSITHSEGRPIFITGGIPGEEVDITIEKDGKKERFGRVDQVHKVSPDRIDLDCSVFGECGGCSYRHISYEDELSLKRELLSELLSYELGKIKTIQGSPTHYRNNVQWQIRNGKPGFFSRFSHSIVDVPEQGCLNLDERLQWENLAPEIRTSSTRRSGDRNSNTKTKGDSIEVRISNEEAVDYSRNRSVFFIKGKTIHCPPKGFFQINTFLIPNWLDEIESMLGDKNEDVLELFCGAGLIGVSLSAKIPKLLGLEGHPKSIQFAKTNAVKNQIKNFEYKVSDLYQDLLPEQTKNFPTWIVNPPRSGLSSHLVEEVRKYLPKKIIYSSCNANTLQRDVKELLKSDYKISHVCLVDFFPRTAHYEVLVLLEKNESESKLIL
ncbi:class I SAM-dependent RNA methyltransferase [Leptospira idonii]|uniref:Class I SAM-dependent RNA methyltransferase n=1 Tax=Leptospira idonii TaxID=1193500 RepID=A0A4R9M2T6_9LEPT|nr:methyltransferase [Leptospira idonii]TGN20301.1 class I SAM-dependent RNA methyltransferase [Leptospira idonii]